MMELKGHTAAINSICLSCDEKLLFSASNDLTVRVWSIDISAKKAEPLKILRGFKQWITSICVSPKDSTVFCGCYDGKIRAINFEVSFL